MHLRQVELVLDFAMLELSTTIFQHMVLVWYRLAADPIAQHLDLLTLFDLLIPYFSFLQVYPTIFECGKCGTLHLVWCTVTGSQKCNQNYG